MIHKEGYPTIVVTLLLIMITQIIANYFSTPYFLLVALSVLSVFLLVMVLQFFRNPKRNIPKLANNAILAPADGKVVVIEDTIESEYFEDERLMISIFMSPINVHSNHHPISGAISYSKYHPGKYLVAWHPKSSTENERHTTVYKSGDQEILIRQIAGAMARRIVNYVNAGDKVIQGEEVGFIKFGSRVDIYLPVGTQAKVILGQKVKSRTDVLAYL